jgi:drug/metabolite transporter (DMT)-like permease
VVIWFVAKNLIQSDFISGSLDNLGQISPAIWALAALSGVIYYGLACWFYIYGLKLTTACEAGFFINLIPLFGLAGAFIFLNERLTMVQWTGALLIILAVFLMSRMGWLERLISVRVSK